MPKNKFQEVVFTILMCLFMVLAMELYNASLLRDGLSGACVPQALSEMRFMLPLCFVTSFFLMDPLAQKIAFSQVAPGLDHPLFVTLVRAGVTVCLMCPSMSFWATLIFHGVSWSFPNGSRPWPVTSLWRFAGRSSSVVLWSGGSSVLCFTPRPLPPALRRRKSTTPEEINACSRLSRRRRFFSRMYGINILLSIEPFS